MECPKCQFENPEGMKFCGQCGKKLEKFCPSCNFSNPLYFSFCGNCGHNLIIPIYHSLIEYSFDEKLEKIQRYLPKGLSEKILAQRDKIEGERKQVTVMFCDMKGFTPLSEELGPEETYIIMDQVYETLIHKVHNYEGTVNEFTGDGVMALFGAPVALEDAPQRAIRSAYAIHREIAQLSEKMKQTNKNIPSFKMRIGIHTGPVIVGTLGNDLRVEFKAVGDTVNLASRMESLAEPGSTYVTEQIFRATEGLFRFEALGDLRVKGKKDTVKAYRVIAPRSRRTRFDVNAERGLTPFVGREREMELLLDGYMRIKKSRGQVLSIISEAGVGKSRLLYELRKAVSNENVTFLEGKCLSYSRGVIYHPIIDILKSNFDIGEIDDGLVVRNKVLKGLEALGVDKAYTSPYLLELLSVKDSGIDKIIMSPEARKDRTIEAIKMIVLKGSEIRPLIMAIEDLHWVDKSSEEALEVLLGSIAISRVFLIFTYRPEYVHSWGARSYHSQVNLNRLTNRESLTMIAKILGTDCFAPDLGDLILKKTEGVPFFIEEFIRSLHDMKVIKKRNHCYYLSKKFQELRIPSTVQDVIMARVDLLPEGAKEVLQTASAIEREFSYQLLKNVVGKNERELLRYLSILKDSELLYERGIYPQSSYIFKHALTREVVYDSIMTKKKKQLHERIGNAIEKLYHDNIIEYYGILAEHYIEGENYEKGARYSQLDSKRARKSGSYKEAIYYGEKRVTCLERLVKSEKVDKELIDSRVTLGLYYNQTYYFSKAIEAIGPIVDLALKLKYKRRTSQIKSIIGTYIFGVKGDYTSGIQYLEDASKIAEEAKDRASSWISNHWLGHAFAENCEFEKALYHLNKALEISKTANLPWSISIMKCCIANTVYNTQGNAELGYQISLEGLEIAEASGDAMSKSEAYVHHGVSCFLKGFLDKAEKHLLNGERYCKVIDAAFGFLANRYLGLIYLEKFKYWKSQNYFNEAISLMENRCAGNSLVYLNKLALIYISTKQHENDINIELLYNYERENKIKALEGQLALWIGKILLALDKPEIQEAEKALQRAINADQKNRQTWNLGMDYVTLSEIFKMRNKNLEAKNNLSQAIKIFKECGANGWAHKFEKKISMF